MAEPGLNNPPDSRHWSCGSWLQNGGYFRSITCRDREIAKLKEAIKSLSSDAEAFLESLKPIELTIQQALAVFQVMKNLQESIRKAKVANG